MRALPQLAGWRMRCAGLEPQASRPDSRKRRLGLRIVVRASPTRPRARHYRASCPSPPGRCFLCWRLPRLAHSATLRDCDAFKIARRRSRINVCAAGRSCAAALLLHTASILTSPRSRFERGRGKMRTRSFRRVDSPRRRGDVAELREYWRAKTSSPLTQPAAPPAVSCGFKLVADMHCPGFAPALSFSPCFTSEPSRAIPVCAAAPPRARGQTSKARFGCRLICRATVVRSTALPTLETTRGRARHSPGQGSDHVRIAV